MPRSTGDRVIATRRRPDGAVLRRRQRSDGSRYTTYEFDGVEVVNGKPQAVARPNRSTHRQRMLDFARKKPRGRARLVTLCEDRAKQLAFWPALAASWQADADEIHAMGLPPTKQPRKPRTTP